MNEDRDPRAAFVGGDRAAGYLEEVNPTPTFALVQQAEASAVMQVPVQPDEDLVPERDSLPPAPVVQVPVSVDALGMTPGTPGEVRARRGWQGAMARLGLPIRPGASERRRAEAAALQERYEAVVRQATWTSAVSALVANPKGSAGKTVTTVCLSAALASIRGGGVAVLEVADDPGSLVFRTEGSPRRGVGELVRDLDAVKTRGQLAGYTAPQTSFASVIGSTGLRAPLDHDAVVGTAELIDEFFEIRLMDSGNQPSSSAFGGAIAVADVLIVPLANAGDVAAAAFQMIDALRAQGGKAKQLADNAVVIRLTDGQREFASVRDQITALLEDAGVGEVFEIPYDDHLAERGQISWERLAPSTRAAFTAAAAGVVVALQTAVQ